MKSILRMILSIFACCMLLTSSMHAAELLAKEEAVDFRKLCDTGHFEACRRAGIAAAKEGDIAVALYYFERGCVMHDDRTCLGAGIVSLEMGETEKAKAFFERSCLLGNDQGCLKLAARVPGTDRIDPNDPYVTKSCHLSNGYACLLIGMNHKDRGEAEIAMIYFSRSCAYEDPSGCYFYGSALHERGRSSEALTVHSENCKLDSDSCVAAGFLLLREGKAKEALNLCMPICTEKSNGGDACICQGLAEADLFGTEKGNKTMHGACLKDWRPVCNAVLEPLRF